MLTDPYICKRRNNSHGDVARTGLCSVYLIKRSYVYIVLWLPCALSVCIIVLYHSVYLCSGYGALYLLRHNIRLLSISVDNAIMGNPVCSCRLCRFCGFCGFLMGTLNHLYVKLTVIILDPASFYALINSACNIVVTSLVCTKMGWMIFLLFYIQYSPLHLNNSHVFSNIKILDQINRNKAYLRQCNVKDDITGTAVVLNMSQNSLNNVSGSLCLHAQDKD